MKKLKAVVVGVGNMGQHHARIYSQLREVELVAVCDLNKRRVKEIAARYQTRPFFDYHHLIKKLDKINVVSIAVPTKEHQRVACFFLKNKVNVLLEKPIALNLKAAEKIIKTAESSGVKFTVGHVERFNPAVASLKKLIKKGTLGKIISVVARRVGVFPPNVKDANVFLDLAIHDIDIINYLLNERPKKIFKHSAKFHVQTQEDVGELLLLYQEAAAFVQVNWVTPVKIRTLSVTGTKGYAELDYISQDLVIHQAKIEKKLDDFSEFLRFSRPTTKRIKIKKEEPLKREIKSFLSAIRNNRQPQVSGEEALESLKICLKT